MMYSVILHGRRCTELQKWPCLRVSVQNAFSNSFSSVANRDGRKGKIFTVPNFVDSFDLITEPISRKVSFEGKVSPDSVLKLFTSHGFTDSQISNIIRTYPRLLILDAEKSVAPKLQFLQSRGASSSELTEVVSSVPEILGKKAGKSISRYYDFIKEVLEADKSAKLEKLCHSLPQGSKQENKIRNLLVLRELGVPQRLLFPLLISDRQHVSGKERFEESLKKVVEMGFNPTTSKFIDALRVIQGLCDKTIEEKVNVYKRLGFSVGDIWAMFKKYPIFLGVSEKKILNCVETFLGLGFNRDEFRTMVKCHPACFGYSAELVKKKTEFVVKKMNWPLKAVPLFPQVFSYSMEKRIVPRCKVIKTLISKGLLGGDKGSELPSMQSVLICNDNNFFNRYVRKHDDKELVAELMAIFAESTHHSW
ncbi:PREDICTED: transcription termination factor MTERF2, chloroplastic-like [Camelina sativa]|uniref:Transcription termination factor MTERF2, chloroplastic-like n=1 Tax=Camelina sativa TaxID=90675 RepID=A0ABM0TRM9_CAMSA|nr:PREDICTED: transcription termination factor MTERF2, chloroplastic-like [Camelina sativa]